MYDWESGWPRRQTIGLLYDLELTLVVMIDSFFKLPETYVLRYFKFGLEGRVRWLLGHDATGDGGVLCPSKMWNGGSK